MHGTTTLTDARCRRGFGLGIFLVLATAIITAIFVAAYYRYSQGLARERTLSSYGLVAANVARSAVDEAVMNLFRRANVPGSSPDGEMDLFQEFRQIERDRGFRYGYEPRKTRQVFTDPGVRVSPVEVRVRFTRVSTVLVPTGVRRVSLWPPPRICNTLQIVYSPRSVVNGLADFAATATAGLALPSVERTSLLRKEFQLVRVSGNPRMFVVNLSPINIASSIERGRVALPERRRQ